MIPRIKGERLSETDRAEIVQRRKIAKKNSIKAICDEFGISAATLNRIERKQIKSIPSNHTPTIRSRDETMV